MVKYLNRRYELIVVAVSLALSVLVYYGVYNVTRTSFELLGMAAVPKFIAISLFFLAVVKIIQIVMSTNNDSDNERESSEGLSNSLVMFSLVSCFILSVAIFKISFWMAIFVFLMASISFLKKPKARMELLYLSLFSLFFALGVDYIFVKVFYFDL